MDKLPALPKKIDVARSTPTTVKFQIKSIAGVDKPVSVTIFGVGGEEITKTGICDASYDISDKNKGDIPIASADTFIKLIAKDAKDEVVGIVNIAVAEWLKYDNGTIVAPLASAKESAKDEKAGKHEGPSYYTNFRECKSDSSLSKGGYVVIRFQFGKGKEKAGEAEAARAPTPSSKSDKDPKESSPKESSDAAPSVTYPGGSDAGVAKLRMSAANGLLVKESGSEITLEVYGPRPEAPKKKATAPRIYGGPDEKESHSLLNSKGLIATRTSPATVSKTSKGETKYSWKATDPKSTAIIFLDPLNEGFVRIHAFEKDAFLGEASITVADLLANKEGNVKLKFEPRKDEQEARIKDAAGKLGQVLVDFSFVKGAKADSAFSPSEGQTHLRLQLTKGDALKALNGATSDPSARIFANGKEICKVPTIANTLYPLWGGEGSVMIPVSDSQNLEVQLHHKDGELLGKASIKPAGPAGSIVVPLADDKGVVPNDKALGSIGVTWLYDTIKVDKEEVAKPPTPSIPDSEPVIQSKPAEEKKEPSVTRRTSSAAPLPKPSFETVPDTAVPTTSAGVSTLQPAPAVPSRSPSTKPPPIVHPSERASSQNPAGLVADFLSEVKPERHDQYAASSTSPYVQSPNTKTTASPPKKVPITVPALLKIRGADMELLESVPRANQIRFLQAILRDIADHLLLDPVQLSIVNVGAGMLIDFKFQLTEDQARRNIMDAFVQKTLAGMLSMRYTNAAFVEQLGGRPSHDPVRHPNIIAETAATFGEFRAATDVAPRLELQPAFEHRSPNRDYSSPLATRGSPRMPPSSTNFNHSASSPTHGQPYPQAYPYTESFQKPYADQMSMSPTHRQYPPSQQGISQRSPLTYSRDVVGHSSSSTQQPPFRPPSPGPVPQRPIHYQQYPQQQQQRGHSPSGFAPSPTQGGFIQQQQQQPSLRAPSGYPQHPIGGQYQQFVQQQPYGR